MLRSSVHDHLSSLTPSVNHQSQSQSHPSPSKAFRANSIFRNNPPRLNLSIPPARDPPPPHSPTAPTLDRPREPMTSLFSQVRYGQITPPDDHWKLDYEQAPMAFADPLSIETTNPSAATISTASAPSGHKRRSSSSSGSSSLGGAATADGRVDKKDKYREKNRVAAAKCRAKKKTHVDGLEENHRTQGMLNSLLKQTEQNLRDELSFWRTQALQHAFCECHAVQDYNLKKAKALAADREFGGMDAIRQHDPSCGASPDSKSALGHFFPSPEDYDMQTAL